MYTCCSIFNKKPKLHHHQQPPDRLKIQSFAFVATKTPLFPGIKTLTFSLHSLQVSFLDPLLHIDRMSLELSIMDMDDKLVAKGNFSLSTKCTMDIDDKLVAKVHCTTKLEGEIKLLYNNIAYLTLSSKI
ncbi:hypothetical protein HanIR_Chr06g0283891 [Helianthus annuus]|nr:hypothetical protein HanIR_Chr06g0283891 [Helianthus annuus]